MGTSGEPAGWTLLAVDDDAVVLRQLRVTLRGAYEISATTDPLEAAAWLRAGRRFDVIVCDQQMPGMRGDELLELARQLDPCGGRIMLTGLSSEEAVVAAKNKGEIHGYVAKPWANEALRGCVRHVASLSALRGATSSPPSAGTGLPGNLEALLFGPRAIAMARPNLMRDIGVRSMVVQDARSACSTVAAGSRPPDLLVCDVDCAQPATVEHLGLLKAALPTVVLVMMFAPRSADHVMLGNLVNRVNPFKLLRNDAPDAEIAQALRSAALRARDIQLSPELAQVQSPQAPASGPPSTEATRLQARAQHWMAATVARFRRLLGTKPAAPA